MKKLSLLTASFFLASLIFVSCSKNSAKNLNHCNDLISKVNVAEINYAYYPTTANCQAYKAALNNMLNCSVISKDEKEAYRLIFDQITC